MLLQETIIYLGAATLAVVLSRKLGFGSVLGYLLAGVLIGPWGLRLVTDVRSSPNYCTNHSGIRVMSHYTSTDFASSGTRYYFFAKLALRNARV